MNSRTPSHYRPDIDGLRAIAVLTVLFYHVGFGLFPGGFVGVDVFFVISGFLITRLILNEAAGGNRFHFANFYVRRARRLFPALFATLCATGVFAVAMFTPTDLARFGGSLLHAIASLSNVYFWSESGYFDADAMVKPLLHTWSLSVEEQFYLFWPALIILLRRRLRTAGMISALAIVGIVSLLLNIDILAGERGALARAFPPIATWFSESRAAIFFLTPFRIFEFVIGALLFWATDRQPKSALACDALTVVGLTMILYAATAFTKETVFPSVNALLPCIGAALVIYGADKAKYTSMLLTNRIAVTIGLISYSLYLIHWPILVFFQYGKAESLNTLEGVAICIISIGAAYLMYRFIEKPFRRPAAERKPLAPGGFAAACLALALVPMVLSANMWANKGWPWRFYKIQEVDIVDLERLRSDLIDYFDRTITYPVFSTAKTKVLVVGDSHGKDMSVVLQRTLAEDSFEVRMMAVDETCWRYARAPASDGVDEKCAKQLSSLERSHKTRNADIVIIANLYTVADLKDLGPFVDFITAINAHHEDLRVVFTGRTLSVASNYHQEAIRLLLQGRSWQDINALAYSRFFDSYEAIDERSKSIIGALDRVAYVSRLDTVCAQSTCDFFVNENNVLVWDGSHLTLTGADLVGERLLAQNPDIFKP